MGRLSPRTGIRLGSVLLALLVAFGSLLQQGTPTAMAVPGTWSATDSLDTGRYSHTATLLTNGKVLVAGGGTGLTSTELYDPVAASWAAAASMGTGRTEHTATLLANGKVLV